MEGYLDVIAVSQAGYPLSVASLGTALTEEQCRLLSRYARKVHLFYDADRAGRSATEKAIDLFEKAGLLVHVSQLEPGEDPDSIVRQRGAEAFGELKKRTVGVVDYLISQKASEFDLTTRAGKAEFSDSVFPALSKIRDDMARSDYVRKLATQLGMTETAIAERVQAIRSGRRVQAPRKREVSDRTGEVVKRPVSSKRASLHAEERLLSLMLKRPEWNQLAFEKLNPQDLTRRELRPFLEVLLQFRSNDSPLTWTDLANREQTDEVVWARLMATEVPESTQDDMERLISDIKRNGLEPRYELIRQQVLEGMSQGTVGPDSELYKEYLYLQKRLKGTRNE